MIKHFPPNIVMSDEVAKQSTIDHGAKCRMKIFYLDQTFTSNILHYKQCLIVWLPHPTRCWVENV